MLSLVLVLDNQRDPLQLHEEALAGAGPLFKAVARVLDARIIDLVALDCAQLNFFAIDILTELAHVLCDEEVHSLEQHGQGLVVALFRAGKVQLELGVSVRLERDLGESSLCMQIVPIEDISEVMGLHAQ